MADIYSIINPVYETEVNVSNRLSRANIQDVLQASKVPQLASNCSFYIHSKNRVFFVFYNLAEDEYYYERLNRAE